MPPRRGHRGGARGAAQSGRGRGSAVRGKATTSHAGVKKYQAEKKRPIQPRVAAALLSAATIEPETTAVLQETPEQSLSEWPAPKVQRIIRQEFMCTPDSLFFVHLDQLHTSEDTEVIALNLMDHFLQAENWIPELWHGLLHAVCFLFAGELTGIDNEIETIAKAVERQAGGLAELGVQDLEVKSEGVRKGYAAVLERRGQLRVLVGGYAEALEALARTSVANTTNTGTVQDTDKVAEESVEEPVEKPVEEDLIDFDVFEEPEPEAAQ